MALHFVLWLRDAAGVALPVGIGRTVPPALLTRPDPIDLSIDADGWLAWWRALLQWQYVPGNMWKWWQTCPATLAEAIEPFRDPGLTWVQNNVKFSAARANRRHGLRLGDHVHTAVTRLQRELGNSLNTLDVAIVGKPSRSRANRVAAILAEERTRPKAADRRPPIGQSGQDEPGWMAISATRMARS